MKELLSELHGDRKFEIFTNFEKKKHNDPKFGPVTVESIPFEKLENLNKDKRGIWFSPNSMKNGKRQKIYVESFNAIVLEFDFMEDIESKKSENLKTLLSLQLKPSAVVETKRGHHVYWFLENDTITDIGEYETLQRLMQEKLGSDQQAIGAERLFRLPGFRHWKDEDEPFRCELIHRDYQKRYSKDLLVRKFGGKKTFASLLTKQVKRYSKGETIKVHEFDAVGDVLDITRGCEAMSEIEEKTEPTHQERLALALTYTNLGNEGLEHLQSIAKNWNDYDPDVTDGNIKHIIKNGYRPVTCDWMIEKGLCKGRCVNIRNYKHPRDLYFHPVRQLPMIGKEKVIFKGDVVSKSEEHQMVLQRIVKVFEKRGQILSDTHKEAILSITKTVMSPIYNDKPIVIPAVPGLGKTTFIIEFLKHMQDSDPYYGAVVVVERQETMDELSKEFGERFIFGIQNQYEVYQPSAYPMLGYHKDDCKWGYPKYKPSQCKTCPIGMLECRVKYNFMKQQYSPIVLISHSRLFQMSDKNDLLEALRFWNFNGERRKRKVLLIDEKPQMADNVSTTSTTWDQLLSDATEYLPDHAEEVNQAIEIIRNQYSYPDKYKRIELLDSDFNWSRAFKEDWHENYLGDHPDYPELLKTIITEGGYYSASDHSITTTHYSNTYWQDYSTFVFDGTADMDPEYRPDKFYFLDVEPLKRYDNLHFHFCMDQNLSLGFYKENPEFVGRFSKDIDRIAQTGKTYLVCYKRAEEEYLELFQYNDNVMIEHYGNTKGANHLIECTNIVCTGILHKGEGYYLSKTVTLTSNDVNPTVTTYDRVRRFDEEGVEAVKLFETVTELIQEIFRTQLRNHSSKEDIHVYLSTRDTMIINLLKDYFVGCDVSRDWMPEAIVGNREKFMKFVEENKDVYKSKRKLVKKFMDEGNQLTPADLRDVLEIETHHANTYLNQ